MHTLKHSKWRSDAIMENIVFGHNSSAAVGFSRNIVQRWKIRE